jgi:hypothetical protein
MSPTNDLSLSETVTSPTNVSVVSTQGLDVCHDIKKVQETVPLSVHVVKRRKSYRGERDHVSSPRLQQQEPQPRVPPQATKFRQVDWDNTVPVKQPAPVCPPIGELEKFRLVRFETQSKVHVMPSRRDFSKEERDGMYMSPTEIKQNASRNLREYLADGCVMENATEEEGFVETVLPNGTRGLVHPATFARLQEQDTCRQRIFALLEEMWQGGSGCSAGDWSDDDNDNTKGFVNFNDEHEGDDCYSVFPLASTGKIMDSEGIGNIRNLGKLSVRRSPPVDFSGFRLEIEDLEDHNPEYDEIHNWREETACV